MPTSLNNMPADIKHEILRYHDGKDLKKIRTVSTEYKHFANNKKLWETLCYNKFSTMQEDPLAHQYLLYHERLSLEREIKNKKNDGDTEELKSLQDKLAELNRECKQLDIPAHLTQKKLMKLYHYKPIPADERAGNHLVKAGVFHIKKHLCISVVLGVAQFCQAMLSSDTESAGSVQSAFITIAGANLLAVADQAVDAYKNNSSTTLGFFGNKIVNAGRWVMDTAIKAVRPKR